jgi:hypothetical protein
MQEADVADTELPLWHVPGKTQENQRKTVRIGLCAKMQIHDLNTKHMYLEQSKSRLHF